MSDVIDMELGTDGVWRPRREGPGRPRSGPPFRGVPRPPEHRGHAGGVAARALAELARLVELRDAAEELLSRRDWRAIVITRLITAKRRAR